ncbi:hypothetical protein [Nonomuraea sp. NPDC049480]|uniref:hypothetical protein n=1 Tax=Nonomuraea sp. NPDC049480 TaxID=3364353 RepID=UPI0037899AE7
MNIRHAIALPLALALALPGPASATGASAAGCGVDPHDHKLYCTNDPGGIPLFDKPRPVDTVDFLDTTESWFSCWATGEQHTGGNTTWYGTVGDRFGEFGYAAASAVHTPSGFDADPSRYGLKRC